ANTQARTSDLPPARHGFTCLRSIPGYLRKDFNTDNSARGGTARTSLWDWRIAPFGSSAAPSCEKEGIPDQWNLCSVAESCTGSCVLHVKSTCGHAFSLCCDSLDSPTRSISFL